MGSGGFVDTPISQDQVLVWVALGLAALLAVLVVAGMVWGARLKRQRVAAGKEEQARIEGLEADGVEATTGDEQPLPVDAPTAERRETATPAPAPAPAPVAPAPPPFADQPVPGTPPIGHDDQPADRPEVADEPVAAAAPLDASPASLAEPTPAATHDDTVAFDELTQLKGLGPRIAARMAELGVASVGDLAALNDAAAERLDAQLGPFTGRMGRDRWREQATLLAAGDRAGFEREFGRL